ncbi:MAG: sigma-70 family RNA polymerase sigma factor [Thermosyntropha sp.]|nr:sigma-70 family RNA polymerase sigma factor [Thermosyntropha sp.]
MIYRYAFYLTGEKEVAQDICQEVFLRWFSLDRPEEIEQPRAWLRKVCTHLSYNYLRHRNVRLNLEDYEALESKEIASNMDRDLTNFEVEEALKRLSWKDQLLLKLRMEGLSYKEIAEVMGISLGSVGTLLARAMKRFKVEYEGKEVADAERNAVSG